MSVQTAPRFSIGRRAQLAVGGFAVAAGIAGFALNQLQKPVVDAFDPSTVDICSANTLCDNTQIKLGLRDQNGNVSVNSAIGKSLTEIATKHAPGKIADRDITDMMTRFEGTLTHAMQTPTAVGTNGMMLMKGPQNPGRKAQFGVYAFVQDGNNGCGAYEIKTDGQYVPAVLPMTISSHSAPVPGCAREIAATAKMMTNKFHAEI